MTANETERELKASRRKQLLVTTDLFPTLHTLFEGWEDRYGDDGYYASAYRSETRDDFGLDYNYSFSLGGVY